MNDGIFKFDVASYSAVGKRKNNEDSYNALMFNGTFLAVVADGLGGYADGELASKAVVSTLAEQLKNAEFSEEGIEDALFETNRDVIALNGPKSTVAMLWVKGTQAFAVNVGDSRIYKFNGSTLLFQSADHSLPQFAVQTGEIRPEDIRTHKDRNKITRCMGGDRSVSPNIVPLKAEVGDRFLLCSDGFWEPVTEADMIRAAGVSSTAERWLEPMKKIAYKNEKDNHTAIAIVVKG